MFLKHVALVCSSKKKSDKFYEQLLGLKKQAPKLLSGELSKQIFNLDSELQIINYIDDNTHFEIFIDDRLNPGDNDKKIEHVCIEVEEIEAFLDKCRALEVKFFQISKGDKRLTFVRDFDGNLFEIKSEA